MCLQPGSTTREELLNKQRSGVMASPPMGFGPDCVVAPTQITEAPGVLSENYAIVPDREGIIEVLSAKLR